MKRTILFLGSILLVFFCCSPSEKEGALGEVTFRVTGSEAANIHFIKGHLLMHSFEYDDARDSFRQAKREDPSCVMAYWGEAMSYNHPIWQEQDRKSTRLNSSHSQISYAVFCLKKKISTVCYHR